MLLESAKKVDKSHSNLMKDFFWMVFIATFPSFPGGEWDAWDACISMGGTFITTWLGEARLQYLKDSQTPDAVRQFIFDELKEVIEHIFSISIWSACLTSCMLHSGCLMFILQIAACISSLVQARISLMNIAMNKWCGVTMTFLLSANQTSACDVLWNRCHCRPNVTLWLIGATGDLRRTSGIPGQQNIQVVMADQRSLEQVYPVLLRCVWHCIWDTQRIFGICVVNASLE
ncbi:hypothetical protein JVT61DRAFT_6977 [Boletus reticuloceps]|uniref:Uncharacterized protein n=1 Tax=Boletus reticuloceps TaxID=495285 RepID=A0A8I2YIG7_9AGAM|nr:hypothetical protein JVT61DRAFT_6977 [Boletus reticuloceps]